MAIDKAVDSSVLDAGLTKIADAIREKVGTSDTMEFPDGLAEAIAAIGAGVAGNYEATGDFELSGSLSGTFTVSTDATSYDINLASIDTIPKIVLYYTQDDASQVSSKSGIVAGICAVYSPAEDGAVSQDCFYMQAYSYVSSGGTSAVGKCDIVRTNSFGINDEYASLGAYSTYNVVKKKSDISFLNIGGNVPNAILQLQNIFAAGCIYHYYVFY